MKEERRFIVVETTDNNCFDVFFYQQQWSAGI
jgi:hypothetical protein